MTQAASHSSYVGGSGDERVQYLVVTAAGDVVMTGYTSSEQFPVTPDATFSSLIGGGQRFCHGAKRL